ncbi:hypothetical protein Poli38472_008521 [Pythium oligandrum]|uniref:Uncharacterized protein n=1 Tax=Pythium oligandrum TaxID=41045 RepID=A0A8K1FEH6_PYTOL|nr:hypothetical protein Poli38472_008521 [Pythium oligandrum]|eukprot:TMW55873.1 hypothetical protein Poli38472_008521 [Pythium oligandrum]
MSSTPRQRTSVSGPAASQENGAIAPVPVPWLHHDLFPITKKVCSTPDGLMHNKKTSVVRVMQELKKGRTLLDQQLAQFEAQLLHVTDFLNGHVPVLQMTEPVASELHAAAVPITNGAAGEEVAGAAAPVGKAVMSSDKSNPLNPVASIVEEDLASETPCTTVGLWRYLAFFSFFKTVTPEDMAEVLQLEDSSSLARVTEDSDVDAVLPFATTADLLPLTHLPPHASGLDDKAVADTLRMRLVAALVAEQHEDELVLTKAVHEDGPMLKKMKIESEDKEPLTTTQPPCSTPEQLPLQLREIGLIETSEDELRQCLGQPEDDEVSNEIRLLQRALVLQVRQNNELKRTLRRSLERTKPWLTHDEEYQQVEAKFLKMWNRKKELQRKKKKQMRKEASFKSSTTPEAPSL